MFCDLDNRDSTILKGKIKIVPSHLFLKLHNHIYQYQVVINEIIFVVAENFHLNLILVKAGNL